MPNLFRVTRLVRAFCLSAVAMLACGTMLGQVVISQVYGSGGNSGSNYTTDYVELFNAGSTPVALDNYAIQYGSSTGTTISAVSPLAVTYTLQPGHYYLVAAASGGAVQEDDVVSTIALSGSAGRVYLTSDSTKLASSCPGAGGTVVDFVAYGASTCFAGTGPAPAQTATTADVRTSVCTITNNNASEFAAASPAPHNSSSPITICSSTPVTNITLSESATKAITGTPVTFTVAVAGNQTAPTGAVTFKDGATTLTGATSSVSGSTTTWTLTTSTLSIATHTITATFAGDSTYAANSTTTPASVSVQVTPVPTPDFTLSLANTQIIATSSSKVQTTVATVSMVAGFNSTVALSCSGVPGGARCVFSPASLTTSGNSTLTIGIDGASLKPARTGEKISLAFAVMGLPLLLMRRKKLARVMLAVLVLGAMSVGMVGCSDSSSTAAGNSTITITGTGGGVTHTATITLTVQ